MATCSALFGATHGDYDRARPCANVVKFKNGEHACSFNVLTAQNGARTPRCDGMRDQVLERGHFLAAKEDVVGRPELVTPVRRSLLLLAFPGPVLGSARVHKSRSVAPHTHTSARKQLNISTCMHGHNFRRQVRTKSTEEAAHRGRASQPPVRTQTQRQLKAGAPAVLRVQAQEKGWRNIQEQREGNRAHLARRAHALPLC